MGVVVTLVVVVSLMLALVFDLTAVLAINPREAYLVVVVVLLAANVVIRRLLGLWWCGQVT